LALNLPLPRYPNGNVGRAVDAGTNNIRVLCSVACVTAIAKEMAVAASLGDQIGPFGCAQEWCVSLRHAFFGLSYRRAPAAFASTWSIRAAALSVEEDRMLKATRRSGSPSRMMSTSSEERSPQTTRFLFSCILAMRGSICLTLGPPTSLLTSMAFTHLRQFGGRKSIKHANFPVNSRVHSVASQ
jgi:hypothetical protein